MKQYYILTIILTLLMAVPSAHAENAAPEAETAMTVVEQQMVKIELVGTQLVITGAAGKTLSVYDLTGSEVISMRIDSNEKRIDVSHLRKSIYPVRVGNVTKKIFINGR